MKNMSVLIDTNIILDWLLAREPGHKAAESVMRECMFGDTEGFVTSHSLADLFYVLRREFNIEKRKAMLMLLCDTLEVIPEDKQLIKTVLNNDNYPDFEDGLQMQCAEDRHIDYIITRNTKDFLASPVKAVLPEDFMQHYLKGSG